jgi:hypothetical protein
MRRFVRYSSVIGYNQHDSYEEQSCGGLPPCFDQYGRPKKLWLPRGIVIPGHIDGYLWGLRIRRPIGVPKYCWVPGGTTALYLADAVNTTKPVMVVEGEIDALTILQVAGDLVTPVATGSTTGARRVRCLARLALAPLALVAYDADVAGDRAARYWIERLPNPHRWRPYWADVNEVAKAGTDLRAWIIAGLDYHSSDQKRWALPTAMSRIELSCVQGKSWQRRIFS